MLCYCQWQFHLEVQCIGYFTGFFHWVKDFVCVRENPNLYKFYGISATFCAALEIASHCNDVCKIKKEHFNTGSKATKQKNSRTRQRDKSGNQPLLACYCQPSQGLMGSRCLALCIRSTIQPSNRHFQADARKAHQLFNKVFED
jgi:hypothetical protein